MGAERDRPAGLEPAPEPAREASGLQRDAAHEQRPAVAADEVQAVGEGGSREGAVERRVDEAGEPSRGLVERPSARGPREERLVPRREVVLDVLQVVEQLQEDAVAEGEALLIGGGRVVTRWRSASTELPPFSKLIDRISSSSSPDAFC